MKFNSSGVFTWAKRLGGAGQDQGLGIAVDSFGSCYITGFVDGTADLDGSGAAAVSFPETPSVPLSGNDVFITKFYAGGGFHWTKRLGGTGDDKGQTASVDGSNNVIIAGYIAGNADLNGDDTIDTAPSPETADVVVHGDLDGFAAKFDLDGGFSFSTRLGGTAADIAYGSTTDSAGNIILTGYVSGNADLDGDRTIDPGEPETADGITRGGLDVFVTKLNSSGGGVWSGRLGGASDDEGRGVALTTGNGVAVIGRVTGNADLDGDALIALIAPENSSAPYGNSDIFIAGFDSGGTATSAVRVGGSSVDGAGDIYAGADGNLYITATIQGDADLDGDGTVSTGLPETASGSPLFAGNDIVHAGISLP